MPSYFPVSPFRQKVRVVRQKRWEHLIVVCLLKKQPDAVANEFVPPGLREQWLKHIFFWPSPGQLRSRRDIFNLQMAEGEGY
jgi:hypothetical protein